MKKQVIVLRDDMLRQRLIRYVQALDLSKPVQVTIEPYRKKRSLSQLRLMWLWISEVAEHVREHTGMDSEDVHAFLKEKFLPPRIIEIAGEAVEYRTTTKLTTAEMSEYMDRIYAWATQELGLLLPLPEEYMRDAA